MDWSKIIPRRRLCCSKIEVFLFQRCRLFLKLNFPCEMEHLYRLNYSLHLSSSLEILFSNIWWKDVFYFWNVNLVFPLFQTSQIKHYIWLGVIQMSQRHHSFWKAVKIIGKESQWKEAKHISLSKYKYIIKMIIDFSTMWKIELNPTNSYS